MIELQSDLLSLLTSSFQGHGFLTLAEICLTDKRIELVAGVVRFRPIAAYCGFEIILQQYMSAV